ncbi:MAG: tetratricopeptide repeat protein [Desulfovibrionaceae bacterium]
MESKIEWYREVLSLEPNSRVFFHLARLFVDNDRIDEAVDTLRQGLDRHPDHIEARLLLIELLSRGGREDYAKEQASVLADILKRYPAFWRAWAQTLAGGEEDFGVALEFAAAYCSGAPLTWGRIIEHGLKSLLDRLQVDRDAMAPGMAEASAGEPAPAAEPEAPAAKEPAVELESLLAEPESNAEPEPEPERELAQDAAAAPAAAGADAADEPRPAAESFSLRTRTMAEVLAAQGDVNGALDIFHELLDNAEPGPAREALEARIRELSTAAGRESLAKTGLGKAETPLDAGQSGEQLGEVSEEAPRKRPKARLLRTLERLAQRLENRS